MPSAYADAKEVRRDSGMCVRLRTQPKAWAYVWDCSRVGTSAVMYVEVKRSRVKGLAAFLGCALFILASLAIIAQGSALTLVVGTAGLLTFTGFGIGWIVLLLRTGPGLVVDDTGFDDRSSATAVGRVSWVDVRLLSRRSIAGTPLVVVDIRDPEAYSARLSRFARVVATANRHMLGSPVVISSVSLKISFESLSKLLNEGLEQYHLRDRQGWIPGE